MYGQRTHVKSRSGLSLTAADTALCFRRLVCLGFPPQALCMAKSCWFPLSGVGHRAQATTGELRTPHPQERSPTENGDRARARGCTGMYWACPRGWWVITPHISISVIKVICCLPVVGFSGARNSHNPPEITNTERYTKPDLNKTAFSPPRVQHHREHLQHHICQIIYLLPPQTRLYTSVQSAAEI